jgi:hypothetical protein
MPSLRLLLGTLALLSCAALTACGEPGADEPAPWTGPVVWQASKPSPTLGRIEAAVVERPSPDRATLEARWSAHPGLGTCELEIVLPEGVFLVEGESSTPLPEGALEGTARWLVEFPVGRDLDAVVRFCGHTPLGPRSADVAVRLVSAEAFQED